MKHSKSPPAIGGYARGAEPKRERDKFDTMADEAKVKTHGSKARISKFSTLRAAASKRGLFVSEITSEYFELSWFRQLDREPGVVLKGTFEEIIGPLDELPMVADTRFAA